MILLAALTGVRFKIAQDEWGIELPEKRGYMNHSAARMWKGHEYKLAQFGALNCQVWGERFGYTFDPGQKGYETWKDMFGWQTHLWKDETNNFSLPDWWGREDVHASHRSVLLSKDYEYYSKFAWEEEPEYKYVWPV